MNLEDIVYEEASPEICEIIANAFPEGQIRNLEFIYFREHQTVLRGLAFIGDEMRPFVAGVSPEDISKTWARKTIKKIKRRFKK